MRNRARFRGLYKHNLFMRFILIFSIISIVTIITFSYLMLLLISQSSVQRQLDVQRRAMESVSRYMAGKHEAVEAITRDIYRDDALAASASYLLEHPYDEYVRYRLDRYFSDSESGSDVVRFLRNKVEDDSDISALLLYSASQQTLYMYNRARQFEIIPTNAARSFVPDAMVQEDDMGVSSPNIWVRKSVVLPDLPMYAVRVPISNKVALRNIGQLLVFYDSESAWASMGNYKEDYKGTILALSADNDVLFDTSGSWYGQKGPYPELLGTAHTERAEMDGMTFTKLTSSQGGFTVVSMVPDEELAATYSGARNTIFIVGSLSVLFAVLLPSLYLSSFARRTHQIIRFTRKVKNGDLGARIKDIREDELGQIGKSFNDMVNELNLYIDRVYKAEIKQKHTEYAALEARVNPHFLYNTLEVIRMRAVSQGAADVGEMIYSLSVLFKNVVRQKPDYALKDELEACRLYLELFRIRYKDRFVYTLECPPELEARSVPKMSLQPIIENYILHGMRSDRKDNRVDVTVRSMEEGMEITVSDNGRGIAPERLAELLGGLKESGQSESFGLRSVHERLQLLFGPAYGVTLTSTEGEGTVVKLRFPDTGKEETRNV